MNKGGVRLQKTMRDCSESTTEAIRINETLIQKITALLRRSK